MALIYTDGDFNNAAAVSLPVFTAPFPVNIDYILTQEWMQLDSMRVPLALNTPHPDHPTFLLVNEGPKEDLGGGVVQWTRTYAKVPASHEQPDAVTYSFIGFHGVIIVSGLEVTTNISGRLREQRVVPCSLRHDYFLLDPVTGNITDAAGAVVYDGPAGTPPPLERVPIIQDTKYYATDPIQAGVYTDFLTDEVNWIVHTSPSREDYEDWLADPYNNRIVVQASKPRRWMGNIIERVTIYILPE